ncbi:MAG: hypothetical protein DHS20C15_05070 [Planctomycetota bacterium]|nr:MAG: hypothetical protein DHS20C15_05070 [Planctomycetota bacterium]
MLLSATLLLATILVPQDADRAQFARFRQELARASDDFAEAKRRAAALLEQGELAAANQAIIDAVPAEERSTAHDFILANLLARYAPEFSYELHRKAFASDPESLYTQLEFGLRKQQRGDATRAMALYELVNTQITQLVGDAPDPQTGAWRVDALLALDRPAEALALWDSLDPARRHTEIESAFHVLNAQPHPHLRRAELLAAIEAGASERIEELIELDLNFDTDWWNAHRNSALLAVDMPRVRAWLADEPSRLADLELLIELTPEAEDGFRWSGTSGTSGVDRAALEAAGLFGTDARLPQSSRVVFALATELSSRGSLETSAWLTTHGAALEERARAGDAVAFELLVGLHAQSSSPRLEELEQLGWDRVKDEGSAAGLLARRRRLSMDDTLLQDALRAHPDSWMILEALVRATDGDREAHLSAISRALRAHFRHLSSWHSVRPLIEELRVTLDR